MKARILVVDDEESLVKLVTHNLQREGYATIAAFEGNEAWEKIHTEFPDLILLDLMLPGMDGLEICRRMRQEKIYTPIIMLTAKDEEIDRVLGLEIGADDYVTKPFSVRELLARIKAILRRGRAEPGDAPEEIEAGNLVIKPANYEVYFRGEKLDLTLKEFQLLEMLVRNRGRVLKRDYLLSTLWGYDESSRTRVLDVHISKLRDKIEPDSRNPVYIETIRGIGYKFEEPSNG
jgi:two-component system alkaline phosphatase synthesis response regulator PhoP